MLKQGHSLIFSWGEAGTVLWLSLCVSYFFLYRASELFAYSKGKIHKDIGLTRGDIAFKRGETQLHKHAEWQTADSVEVRFKAHQGDQKRRGVVLSRNRAVAQPNKQAVDIGQSLGAQGGGLEIMTALMLVHPELDANAPLTRYASHSKWRVWTREQATTALRELVRQHGVNPSEYALHSGRIGGVTPLASAGILPDVIQREDRWRS
ncbi:unnamed protein product, partial [Sphacelaria rigidula]